MSVRTLLFLALGETEVPAFRSIAGQLTQQGAQTRVVTWLPRLSGGGVECLADKAAERQASPARAEEVLGGAGFGHYSMAADYDRDWYFASVREKSKHVERILGVIEHTFDHERPTHLLSSVGGETARVVAEAVAAHRGITRWYLNAIPVPGRFVLLPSLAAPFVPWEDDGRPRPSRPSAVDASGYPADTEAPPLTGLVREGAARLVELAVRPELYPRRWLAVRTGITLRQRGLAAFSADRSTPAHPRDRAVLFPLHDERDFQVAVRERHAVPQIALLHYLSSVLPPGYRLYVKPHPQHRADHHPVLWRSLRARPNVTFLPMNSKASQAIEECDVVFTLASSLGFEALEAGKPVVCYGSPFYSGRGLTIDVTDIRTVSEAIVGALDHEPDAERLAALKRLMDDISWPGKFTPLSLAHDNLALIGDAFRDALGLTA